MPGPLTQLSPSLYRIEDTCACYVVKDGDRAILIDCGSGSVLDLLPQLGVSTIEWILFTHHHRDQCFGTNRLVQQQARIAVPEHERYLFEHATRYWQQKRIYDNYNDRSTFFALGEDVPVSASLRDYESFEWGPYSFYVLPTPGHTLGSLTLIAHIDGVDVAFTGDLMHEGGKLYQLHAMEYEYGDVVGTHWVSESLQALGRRQVQQALPSHGPVIEDPAACMQTLDERLHGLIPQLSYRMGVTADGRFAHEVEMEAITPHLLWGSAETCSNFYVIKAESGKALLIDYPYSSMALFMVALHSAEPFARLRFTEHHLHELQEKWGITSFDVVIPTHYHDDHVCGIPHLQRHYGTRCWALDDVGKILEAPQNWNTPCLLPTPIRIDRSFADHECFEWEGIPFEMVLYPGQTEYHAAILAQIDGRCVFFPGDSTYPLERYVPGRTGEWMVNTVLRNALTLSMHRKCVDEFDRLRPDLLCPGHGPHWDIGPEAFAEHRQYVEEKEALWRQLLPQPADLGVDLFWARLVPYQLELSPGRPRTLTLQLRNSFEEQARFEAAVSCTGPVTISPGLAEISLAPEERGILTFDITADQAGNNLQRHLVTADLTVNGSRHGPIAESLATITT